MARKVSVYLSDRAIALPRLNESLSGRINTVADRYTELIAQEAALIRSAFTDDQWRVMVDAWQSIDDRDTANAAAIVGGLALRMHHAIGPSFVVATTLDSPLSPPKGQTQDIIAKRIHALRPVDRILLVELLEAEAGPQPTHPAGP